MELYRPRQLLPIEDVMLSHDSLLNRDLFLVVSSATEEFTALFSLPPPAGIRPIIMLYDSHGPRTDSTTDTTRYRIHLSVDQWNPEQLVYQLGHELCHVFTDLRRSNWFVESCCAMASTVLLRRMSKLWGNKPHPPDSRRGPRFQQYAKNVTERARKAHQPDIRQGQVLNAEILRPIFNQSLQNWNALCFLGQASTCPPSDLSDWNPHQVGFSFDRWLQAVPPYLDAIVRRIARIPEDRWNYRLQP